MSLKDATASLDEIAKSLAAEQDVREILLRNTREIILLCGKSIIRMHGGDADEAKSILQDADRLLCKYREKVVGDLGKYLMVPEQEFVEASALISIAEKRQIPSKDELRVSGEAYILGLLDCIGELKRFMLDKIRGDDLDEALRIFYVMEEMFGLLYPFASLDKMIKDARRKTDVDRILIEDARSVITQEIRRKELIDAMGTR